MFSFGRPDAELSVIYDIGSSSVGAGLVRFEEGKLPHIVFTLRESIPFRENVEPERFFRDMIEVLERVNAQLLKEGLRHLKFTSFGAHKVRHVVYAFSSPWAATQTKIATIEKPAPYVLTKAMVDKVLDDEEKRFESSAINVVGDASDKLSAMEKRVIQITLNGYAVAEPYGKSAKRADITFFTSIIPKVVFDKVFDASLRTYHPKDTKAFSSQLVAFSLVRDIFHEVGDFVYLDVGGELSDISVVKDGLILETASMPLGTHFLRRQIAKAFGISPDQAESMLKLHFEEHGDDALAKKLEPLFEKASKEWNEVLHTVLSKLSDTMSLPQNLFLSVTGDLVQFFVRNVKGEKVSQLGVDDVPFNVTLLNADKLRSVVTYAADTHKDPFIGMISAFLR